MNKKMFLTFIPILLIPYIALFSLAAIFFSTTVPFFEFLMQTVFRSNIFYFLAVLLIYCAAVTVYNVICFFVSIRRKWDMVALAKTAMTVKLIQVPAYVLIFVLGVFMAITIFTIPFAVGLFVIDCLALFMTGLPVIASAVMAKRQGVFSLKEVFWVIALQFVFCADVIVSVMFYLKLKRYYGQITNN